MKLKLSFILILSLIILFSIGAVVASENATITSNVQTVESDIVEAPDYTANSTLESEVLGDSNNNPFEYNRVSYDFGGITYESNAFISEGAYIGKGLIPDTIFAWTITVNTAKDNISKDIITDSRLPISRSSLIMLDENNETHYPNSDDSYELEISGLKLPEGLEYINHYADLGTYNLTTGSWIIKEVPKNSLISLTVISKVIAKPGDYIPGFYVTYEKRYPFYMENMGFDIWEKKLVLSNETKEINYTEEISHHIPKQYLPSGPYEIVKFNESYNNLDLKIIKDNDYTYLVKENVVIDNESYRCVFKFTKENINNFYMILDENGTISNFVYYTISYSVSVYSNNLTELFTLSWVSFVSNSGMSWRNTPNYYYPNDAYSNYRVLMNQSSDTNSSNPESNNNPTTQNTTTNINSNKKNIPTSHKIKLNYSNMKNILTLKITLPNMDNILSSFTSILGHPDETNNSSNPRINSTDSGSNINEENTVDPIFIAILIPILFILIYIIKRQKN